MPIITRNNRAEFNVAGLEIENSFNADVYDNVPTNNTGGILVFDLPDLPQQGGHHVRVYSNPTPRRIHIHDNVFGESGGNPDPGEVGALFMDALGTPMPHIVWGGVMPRMDFFVWGMDDEGIHDNTYETGRAFGNANLIVYMAANFLHRSKYDLGKMDASYPSLPEVTVIIGGVDVNDQTF